MKNKKRGFTLVELLVVIAILAILATVSVVGYTAFIDRARKSNCETEAYQVKEMIQADILAGSEFSFGSQTTMYSDANKSTSTTEENSAVAKVTIEYIVKTDSDGKAYVYTRTTTQTKTAAGTNNAWGAATTADAKVTGTSTTAIPSAIIKSNEDLADLSGTFSVATDGASIEYSYPTYNVSATISWN